MALTEVMLKIPEEMVPYIQPDSKDNEDIRNAMIMYPYVRSGEISHGRAAEIIGIKKWDLIMLYDSIGIPYLSSISDYEEDLKTIRELPAYDEMTDDDINQMLSTGLEQIERGETVSMGEVFNEIEADWKN